MIPADALHSTRARWQSYTWTGADQIAHVRLSKAWDISRTVNGGVYHLISSIHLHFEPFQGLFFLEPINATTHAHASITIQDRDIPPQPRPNHGIKSKRQKLLGTATLPTDRWEKKQSGIETLDDRDDGQGLSIRASMSKQSSYRKGNGERGVLGELSRV